MNFASDNAAGIAPEILRAIGKANEGFALAYGRDEITARLERRFCELFERDVAVFLVVTGTAANALALAHVSPPWGAILCHEEAHLITDVTIESSRQVYSEPLRQLLYMWTWLLTVAAISMGGPADDVILGGKGLMAYGALILIVLGVAPPVWVLWRYSLHR